MKFLERDLEDIIMNTPNEYLNERGLNISGHKRRQERIGNYGIADILTLERPVNQFNGATIKVFELKKDIINADTLLQVGKYVSGINYYLHNIRGNYNYKVEMTLIGKRVDTTNDFVYLLDLIEGLELYTYEFKYDGIYFNHTGNYCLRNHGL